MERAGIPTVLITALPSVALNLGANRVVQGARFDGPLGQPEMSAEHEREWRLNLVRRALQALQTDVSGPTLCCSLMDV